MARKQATEAAALREANARIAANYDAMVYDPPGDSRIGAGVLTLAALYGANGRPADALDIGCGSGAQLERVAPLCSGRLVGIDISAEAIRMAKARFEALGRDADLRCADIMDVEPEDLGQFDLILCVGSLYVVPGPVRDRMLDLIGRRLKPGGVALLSYYAGMSGDLGENLQRLAMATVDPAADRTEQIAQARALFEQFENAARQRGAHPQVIERASYARAVADVIVFHEFLGGHFSALHTLDISRALEPHGVGFCGYLGQEQIAAPTAAQRAIAQDAVDVMAGGYYYAVFSKWRGEDQALDLANRNVVWSTDLKPDASGEVWTGAGGTATVPARQNQLVLEAIAERPQTLREAFDQAAGKIPARDGFDEAAATADFHILWNARLVTPSVAS